MIITISGTAGSGKSTIAKALAKKLKLNHYSTGDFMRELAEHRGLSIMEFSKLAEKDRETDLELDQRQTELGKNEDNFVIDGRLSFHFIPKSIKIYLDADLKVRAERIFKDRSRTEGHLDLDDTIKNIQEREASEKKRYKEYYNLQIKKENFDLVIDTTDLTVGQSVDKIIEFLKQNN